MGIPEDPPESPMTAEIPLATATEVKSASSDVGVHKRRNILVAAIAVIIIIAAILIGVLIPYNNNCSSSSSNKSVEAATDPPKDPTGTKDPEVTIPPIDFVEYYRSAGPLSLEVPIASPNNIGVFENEEEAKSAITNAGLFLVDNAILRNMGQEGFENVALGGANRGQGKEEPIFFEPGQEEVARPPEAPPDAGFAAGDESAQADDLGNANGYDTNNQEDKVDQADVSKSDGTFIFTAFGDYLIVMRAEKSGDEKDPDAQLVIKLQMPQIEWPKQDYGYPCNIGVDSGFAASEPFYGCGPPKPSIQSLFLSEDRLGVVVSGYGDRLRAELDQPTVIGNFLGTHLRLYDTSELDTNGQLKLMGVQDIHGYFSEGYMIGDVAHIVTMSYVNTWDHLISKVEPWSPAFVNLNSDQYIATVIASAHQIANDFSNQVIKELSLSTGVFPKMATIGLDIDGELSEQPGFENVLFGDGYLNSMVQISSFDANEASVKETGATGEPELELNQTVKFLPTSWAHVYSASDKLVVAGQGSRWDSFRRGSEETTRLFTFDLSGTVVRPEASGSVPGSLLNEYSIDYFGGYLRVATTIRNFWSVDAVFIRPFVELPSALPPSTPTGSGMATPEGNPGGRDLQKTNCPDVAPNCFDANAQSKCIEMERECQNMSIEIVDECNVVFECEPESRTLNQLFVLEISETNSTKLEIVGNVSLGEPNEVFMSVRFFDYVAFFVTFEQTDPFYVVDFPNPATPRIQGELKISGFSRYLHSMNAMNTLLIGIGQETNDDGRNIGLKIDLYDASIRTEPLLIDRYFEPDQWSTSGAEWDEKSLRYVPFDEESGLLVIPVSKQTTSIDVITDTTEVGWFSGFSVFTVDTDGIAWLSDISHVEDVDSCFYCNGYTMDRTFVIDGKLISIHGKSARSHDLANNLAPVWGLDFAWGNTTSGECCSW